ncbi:hypothetical protein FKM82_023588 [Ascaphus truei]
MKNNNETTWVSEFILLGLTNDHESQLILFAFFLVVYVITLLGNSLMVFTITLYLPPSLSHVKRISFPGCVAQLYSFISFGGIECVLLAVMAGDRYVAICMPLRYMEMMSRNVCLILAAICWIIGLLNSLAHTVLTFRLPFCKSKSINHFFCDIPPLLALSCADTTVNEVVVYTAGGSVIVGSFLLTLLSYIFIVTAVLKIKTVSGRLKTFSTCASHLIVVTLFFGTSVFTYIRPTSTYSLEQDRVVPVLYGIMNPMLNPLIYSFMNKEVQGSLRKAICRRSQPHMSR